MNRYFLHTEYFEHLPTADEEGAMFASVEAATMEATLGLREMVCAAIQDKSSPTPRKIRVLDDAGKEVGAIDVMEILPVQLRG